MTGPGWDAHSVYIGVSTSNDAQRFAASIGYQLPIGNAEGVTKALVDYVNAHGGLLGRKLIPIYRDHSSASIAANAQEEAQSDCAYFSSDKRVIAYFDSSLGQTSGIANCMHQAHIPFVDANSAIYRTSDFQQLGPYLWPLVSPDVNRLIPTWIARLQALGYFHGWNTLSSKPATSRARMGLYLEDNPLGHQLAGWITNALPAAERSGVISAFYSPPAGQNDASNAVLKFRSAGVTHVLTLPSAAGAWALFMEAAENEQYYPRYGITSYDWPLFAEQNVPKAQLVGSVGVGWRPAWDVDSTHQPALPGQSRCLAALNAEGQGGSFSSGGGNACDAAFLLADAIKTANGLGPEALRVGIEQLGARFKTAGTFRSGESAENLSLPGAVEDLAYNTGCSCFLYTPVLTPM